MLGSKVVKIKYIIKDRNLDSKFSSHFLFHTFNISFKILDNMRTQSIDTHSDAEKILIPLLKKESISKKLSQIRSLSQMTIQLSRRAISRANENLNEEQVNLLFINYHYGNDLEKRVKKYIEKLHHEKP